MKPKPTVKFRTPDGAKWVSIVRPSKSAGGGEIAEAFPVEDKS